MAFNSDLVEKVMKDKYNLEANAVFVHSVERVTLKLAGNYYNVCSAIQELSKNSRLDISLGQPVGDDADKWDIVLAVSIVSDDRSAAEKLSEHLSG